MPLSNLIGAVCASEEDLRRMLDRLPKPSNRSLLLFGPHGALASLPDQAVVEASFFGFLAGPALVREDRPAPMGSVVALHGHLLIDGGAGSVEGATAAEHVLRLYRQGGEAAFGALSGNFAFVVLDARRGAWLVRDAAGTKPLFIASGEGRAAPTVFGASALEVRRVAQGRMAGDADALRAFLRDGRAPQGERTLLAGVRAVPGGCALRVDATGVVESRSQRVTLAPSASGRDVVAAAPELFRLLCMVTAAQTSPTTSASALSGGLDSSAILAALHAGGVRRSRCFSFSHDHDALPAAWHERAFAEQAAAKCDADVTYVGLAASALPQLLSEVCQIQDFPFGSPVVLAQAQLFRVASAAGVDRILSGHGPDSLFGGGSSHVIARAADLIAAGRVIAAGRLVVGGSRFVDASAARLAAATLAQLVPRRGQGVSAHSRLARALEGQLHDSVIPVSLITEECNARACGIDNRLPYLVREVLAFAASLSRDAILPPDGETKAVLRRAFADHLPSATLSRQRAIGFAVPVLPWLLELGDWAAGRIAELRRFSFYSGPPAHTTLERLRRGDASAWHAAFVVWRWLILAEWIDTHDVRFD